MRTIDSNKIEYIKDSWKHLIINGEDGYIHLGQLSEQINMFVFKELKHKDLQEDIEHIRTLTGLKEIYHIDSTWLNIKGWYIHPFLALRLVSIKKFQDLDYTDYYKFVKTTIFNFLEKNQELKEQYHFIEEFYG